MDEYIILNKTDLKKKLKDLTFQREREPDNYTQSYLDGKIKQIKELLDVSVSLIPEIEKAFDAGVEYEKSPFKNISHSIQCINKKDYVSKLKLKHE